MNAMIDLTILLVSTLRLTRLVTTDDLGEWLLRNPAHRWAYGHDRAAALAKLREHRPADAPPANFVRVDGWRSKLVDGLYCPFCVGYWLGVANLLAMLAVGAPSSLSWLDTSPWPLLTWRVVMGTLALNYLVGQISARLDSSSHEEG